ncbi:MAG: phage major capsid protein, partial [Pseudomonadota bacterium]
MQARIKELRESARKYVEQAREADQEITTNTDETRAAELTERFHTIMAEHDKAMTEVRRLEQIEAAEAFDNEIDPATEPPRGEQRSTGTLAENAQIKTPAETELRAFEDYLSRGNAMAPESRAALEEVRAQGVTGNAAGGFTVPTTLVPELITAMRRVSPMLDPGLTRVLVTASGEQLTMPFNDDTANEATLIGENVDLPERDFAFGEVVVASYKFSSGTVKVSTELLEDAAIDINTMVLQGLSTRFSRGVGRMLTNGTGVNQPQGIVPAASVGVTGAAGAITFDDLIDLQHSVDPAYRAAPTTAFMFSDPVLRDLRKIKNNDGYYIWQPASVQTGAAATILGERYAVNQAMAGTA